MIAVAGLGLGPFFKTILLKANMSLESRTASVSGVDGITKTAEEERI